MVRCSVWLMLVCMMLASGCRTVQRNELYLQTSGGQLGSTRLDQQFDQVWYARLPDGNYELAFVANDTGIGDDEDAIEHRLYVCTFWYPQPGRSAVEKTQTNARLVYMIRAGKRVWGYEGMGFVSLGEVGKGALVGFERTARGQIESSALRLKRSRGDVRDRFGPCELTGAFEASKDRAKVVEILHEIEQELGAYGRGFEGQQ